MGWFSVDDATACMRCNVENKGGGTHAQALICPSCSQAEVKVMQVHYKILRYIRMSSTSALKILGNLVVKRA